MPFTGVPGYNHIKIKEAYGLTKQYVAEQLANQGVSDRKSSRPGAVKLPGPRPCGRCEA